MEDPFKKIESLEEEIKRIKLEIEKKKEMEGEHPLSKEREEQFTSEVFKEHIEKYPPEELGEKYRINKQEKEEHFNKLAPEEDDRKIEGLLKIADTKGVVNAFEICKKLGNPHLLDDFHRMLVEWWKNKGY